jgi:hypothetical protein
LVAITVKNWTLASAVTVAMNTTARATFCTSIVGSSMINNVPIVTCHCPIGESLAGTPVPRATAFLTQADQGDPATCAMYPVSGLISLPSRVWCGQRTDRQLGSPRTIDCAVS